MIMVSNRHHLLSIIAFLLGLMASEVILVGEGASPTFSMRGTAESAPLAKNGPPGSDSTLKSTSVLSDQVAGEAGVQAPAAAVAWFVRLLAIWGILLMHLARVRKRKERDRHAAINESTEHVTPSLQLDAECSAEKAPLYREVIDGYNRLKDGTASNGEVDELRRSAKRLLTGGHGQRQNELQKVKELLDWLDNARMSGRITITVQQLRERKMGLWGIEYGIDAGGQTIKAKKNVKGNAEVDGCVLNVPWDASGGIKVWMHLTDSGYETCWGHFGPITMSSAQVLQDPSGMSRAFHTDQFDKDFRLVFKIQRNFGPLPSFASNTEALTDVEAIKA